MKHIGKFFTLLLLLFSLQGFGQWSWNPININPVKRIQTVNFLTDDLGYAMMSIDQTGAKSLEKTTDGGMTWTIVPPAILNADFQDFHFHADGQGVAVYRSLQNPTQPTTIHLTTNDGAQWQNISPDTTATGMGTAACQFLDNNIGYFTTDAVIYATTNCGTNWSTDTVVGGYPMTLDFIDANHGTVGLFDGTFGYMGGMLTTTDGGATWTQTTLTEVGTVIGLVRQLTTTISIAAPIKFSGYPQTKFFKTTNNGLSWDTLYVPDTVVDPAMLELDFRDTQYGVAAVSSQFGGVTNMYETTDGGTTWSLQDTFTVTTVTDLQLTPTSGYFTGELGKFYRLEVANAIAEPTPTPIGLWPNPVAAGHNIHWDASETFTQLHVIDLSGKLIAELELTESHIALPSLPVGMYLLRFQGNGNMKTARVMVD
jgi:photosystem II stability/assembly factor-like uncharacterized protein